MKKQEINKILMSMRTTKNEAEINRILGKIDIMEEAEIQRIIEEIGDDEQSIRAFLEKKISKLQEHSDEKYPINEMFTYGMAGNCIHLHLPVDLHEVMMKKGPRKTMDIVNLQLLDAIDRIRMLKNNGFHRFQKKDSIYMISPILLKRELEFLESMDFETHIYRKRELQEDKFIEEHQEAQLATHIFGKDKNIGTALIKFQTINSNEWQNKKRAKIEEFNQKGISIQKPSQEKSIT